MTDKECAALKQPKGCKETISVADFVSRIGATEKDPNGVPYQIGICITPAGESSIANEIMELERQ